MKIVMFKRNIQFRNHILRSFTPYCIFDVVLKKAMQGVDSRDVRVWDPAPDMVPYWDGKRPVKNMLVMSGGGAGDRVQITPGFRKLYKTLGNKPFDVCSDVHEEWDNLPYVAVRHPWIPRYELLQNYDAVCSFEDVLGKDNERTTHLAELFAERLFVAPLWPGTSAQDPGELKCDWAWGEGELERCAYIAPKPDGAQWVALQWESHGKSRNWPVENAVVLSVMLATRPNTLVLLIGSRGQGPQWAWPVYGSEHILPDPVENVVNLCGQFETLRQLAAFLTRCDLLIAPDSGPLHVAGALGIPSIGLYGPHTYETRGRYFPTQRPSFLVDDTDDRCPCYTHADQQDEPIPCGEQCCKLMASITPAHVFKVATEVLDAQLTQQDVRPPQPKSKRVRKCADVGC